MQEPQYRSPGVRELLDAVAKSRVPCMSIMNMPPLPYLKRIPGLATDACTPAIPTPASGRVSIPRCMTLCSPDPQAFRPPEEKVNVLQVTAADQLQGGAVSTPTAHTAMLRQLQADIEAVAFRAGDGKIDLPVKLKVHESIFVPLAKWAMLMTGNYRCVQQGRGAVHQGSRAQRTSTRRGRSTTGCASCA